MGHTDVSRLDCPLVSVIISTYMQARALSTLLASLARQDTRDRFEVLVCDDGSTSESFYELKNVLRNVALDVRYIWQPDLGFRLSRSRNNAVRCARGKILLFLDGDVFIPENLISQHIQAHVRSNFLVFGSRSYVFTGDISINDETAPPMDRAAFTSLQQTAALSSYKDQTLAIESGSAWAAILGCNFSVTRSAAVSFDESFTHWGFEDNEFACRLLSSHSHEAVCPPGLEVIGVEPGTEKQFSSIRPRTSEEIEGFISDLVYFCRQYPAVDLFFAWYSLRFFEFNSITKRWCRNEISISEHAELEQRFQTASEWYDRLLITNAGPLSLRSTVKDKVGQP